jgi:hypothetical protein
MSKIKYIKISKIDENGIDQTNSLQSLNQITLPWGGGSNSPKVFQIKNLTEYLDYFLYEIEDNTQISNNTITNNSSSLEYEFSASLKPFFFIPQFQDQPPILPPSIGLTPIIDNLNFYSSNLNINGGDNYHLRTYPQKDITIKTSGSIGYTSPGSPNITIAINRLKDNFNTILSSSTTTSNPITFNFEETLTDIHPNEKYYLTISSSLSGLTAYIPSPSSYFIISSSISTGNPLSSIPEPYFSEDFKNAFDCQPLYGNVLENQDSYKYQQIDYSTNINQPVNFNLIISGSALRAQVQDSNYTSLSHITPRYLGSKNTTELVNKWTDSNINQGNFGKTPSIESLKSQVAIAKWVRGWSPEKNNTSTIKISHLIDEDGNLTTPKATENFIYNLENTFQSDENIKISFLEENETQPFTRKVFRSGKTIEPYFYNQIEYLERDNVNSFTASLDFEEINPSSGFITENYTALLAINPTISGGTGGVWTIPNKSGIIASGSNTSSDDDDPLGSLTSPVSYKITPSFKGTNIESITIEVDSLIRNNSYFQSSTFYARLVRDRSGVITELALAPAGSEFDFYGDGTVKSREIKKLQFRYTINTSQLLVNDIIRLEYLRGHTFVSPLPTPTPTFQILQSPPPTPSLIVSGSDFNDQLFTGTFTDNIIQIGVTDSAIEFINTYYNNPQVKQEDISGSGYNPISLPITFQPGDEVRFEGDKIFIIKDVVLGFNGTILIHLDKPINDSNGDPTVDLNKFSFIRYVEDPTTILMEGFRPSTMSGATTKLLIEPDFITEKLEKNIDKYLNDLTEKGLI